MSETTEPTAVTAAPAPNGDFTPRTSSSRSGIITRTTGPATTDGTKWEVQLSAVPTAEWLKLFRMSGDPFGSRIESPQRVVFDRASLVFKSDEDHVEQWIASLDRWIAWTEARYAVSLDEASLERSTRMDADARQRERIQQLNDRFKNL